jgi:hypothetical protein
MPSGNGGARSGGSGRTRPMSQRRAHEWTRIWCPHAEVGTASISEDACLAGSLTNSVRAWAEDGLCTGWPAMRQSQGGSNRQSTGWPGICSCTCSGGWAVHRARERDRPSSESGKQVQGDSGGTRRCRPRGGLG